MITAKDQYGNLVDNPAYTNSVKFDLLTSDLNAEFSVDNLNANKNVVGTGGNTDTYYSFNPYVPGDTPGSETNPPEQLNNSMYQFTGSELPGGTLTVYAILGAADVNNVAQTLRVSDYGATGSALNTAVTQGTYSVNVKALAATQLSFTQVPVVVQNGAGFGITVSTTDVYGNVVPVGGSGTKVTLQLTAGGPVASGSFATSNPSMTMSATQSSVTFSNLTLPTGQGYQLEATDSIPLAIQPTSTSFNVAGPVTQIAFAPNAGPSNVTLNTTMNQVSVQLEDFYGNYVYEAQVAVTLAIYSSDPSVNPSAAKVQSYGPSVTNGLGVSYFNNVTASASAGYSAGDTYFAVATFTLGGVQYSTESSFVVNAPGGAYA